MEFSPEIQGRFNIHKQMNVIYYTNKINVVYHMSSCDHLVTHMVISIDGEKAFEKNSTCFHNKNSQQITKKREMCRYIIKAIYDKPTANITLNKEKLKAFPLRSGTRQGCPLLLNTYSY